MERVSMARYPKEIGGYYRLWSRLWLNDEKINHMTDGDQGKLVRVHCVANECNSDGRFECIGITLTKGQVAEKAKVPVSFIDFLMTKEIGMIREKPFGFTNWDKYNPKSGEPWELTLNGIKSGIKNGIKSSGNKVQALSLKPKDKA